MNQEESNYSQTNGKSINFKDKKTRIIAGVVLLAMICAIAIFASKNNSLAGSDIDDFKIKINGTVYSMPDPVSKFKENGWDFEYASDAQASVAAGDTEWVTMAYKGNDDIEIDMKVYNPSEKEVPVEQCMVYYLDIVYDEDYAKQFKVELPKGVKLGITNKTTAASKYSGTSGIKEYDDELYYSKKANSNVLEIQKNRIALYFENDVLDEIQMICIN